ncbi:probable protein phosphatase 2c 51 [Phtheirospermum japonicum]|uniref:Probable protein phosphatase 2c 51 n=1 Tax=Phtheirospermum japonicum TaxID=374723 RepID=A0A830D6X1_9LAMI|nr:probable protein phosphatase 2c 51 [Phtheirospermum japonicum]
MAVFDGHNGSEASEMASELLLEYFVLHTYFLLDVTYSFLARKLIRRLPDNGDSGSDFQKTILEESFPFELLKEALLRAIHDIDTAFSMDAPRYNVSSGTTATIALLADTQILVANIGDSKAFLCSEIFQSPSEAKATVFRVARQRRADGVSSSLKEYHHLKSMASHGWTYLIAKELTNDHHPDRDDEKSRVESAGGNITKWAGVARVNGQLAVSRAIGDINFKSFGVISVPEVTDWLPLTVNDSYVIIASDGVFEKLKPQDVCDTLSEPLSRFTTSPEFNSSCLISLADCIVNTAFERGSMDNMAAITIPVRDHMITLEDRSCDYLAVGDQRQIYENSSDSPFLNSSQFVLLLF